MASYLDGCPACVYNVAAPDQTTYLTTESICRYSCPCGHTWTTRWLRGRDDNVRICDGSIGRPEWGPWLLDTGTGDLWIDVGVEYRIHLPSRCRTPAQALDWICQVADKPWGDSDDGRARVLRGFVRALVDILDPQKNLCSWGGASDLTAAQVTDLVRAAVADQVPNERQCAA